MESVPREEREQRRGVHRQLPTCKERAGLDLPRAAAQTPAARWQTPWNAGTARRGAELSPVGAAWLQARCRGAGWAEGAPPSRPLLLIGVIKARDGASVAALLLLLSLRGRLREG